MTRKFSLLICFSGYLLVLLFVILFFNLTQPHDNLLFIVFVLDLTATLVVFLFSILSDNSSFYDPYWSLAPVPILLAFYNHAETPDVNPDRQWIILTLVFIWAIRLTYNWIIRWKGFKDEDWRYAAFRSRPLPLYWLISLAGFHFFPTLIVFAGCLSVYPAMCTGTDALGIIDAIAFILTFTGISVELIADYQLKKFHRTHPPGSFLAAGLWKYSRHPNYLGEILFWTGLFTFSAGIESFHWYTLTGPIGMFLMFTLISVPMMDKRMRDSKPGYDAYAAKTGALFPWLKR